MDATPEVRRPASDRQRDAAFEEMRPDRSAGTEAAGRPATRGRHHDQTPEDPPYIRWVLRIPRTSRDAPGAIRESCRIEDDTKGSRIR